MKSFFLHIPESKAFAVDTFDVALMSQCFFDRVEYIMGKEKMQVTSMVVRSRRCTIKGFKRNYQIFIISQTSEIIYHRDKP